MPSTQTTALLPTAPVPMTVRWVLAVMLVTTLVAMHSHSPWSSLLRARNWRLPLGRALCLLLLGFPTLAKKGGNEEGGSGMAKEEPGRQGRREATNTSEGQEQENRTRALGLHPHRPSSRGPITLEVSPATQHLLC